MLENAKEYQEQKAINRKIKDVLIEKAERKGFNSIQISVLKRSPLQIGIHPDAIQNLITDDIENYLCQWCDHIVRQPLQCKDCTKKYCADCAAILHLARYNGESPVDSASKARFLCCSSSCAPHGKGITGPVTDIQWMERYNATRQKCPRSGCRIWIAAPNMAIHLNQCRVGYYVTHACWSLRAFSSEEYPVRAEIAGPISHRLYVLSRYNDLFLGKTDLAAERPLQPGNPDQENLSRIIKPIQEKRPPQMRRPRTPSPELKGSQRESSVESEPKKFKENNMPHQISIIKDDRNQIIEFKSVFGMPNNQHQVNSIISTVESITKALVNQDNFKIPTVPPKKSSLTSSSNKDSVENNSTLYSDHQDKLYQSPSTSQAYQKENHNKEKTSTFNKDKNSRSHQSQRDLKTIWPVRSSGVSCSKEVKFTQERPQFIRRQNSFTNSTTMINQAKSIRYVTKPKETNTIPFNKRNYEDLIEDMDGSPIYYIDRFVEFVPIEKFDRIRQELKELSTFRSYSSYNIDQQYGSTLSLNSCSTYSISDAAKKRSKSTSAKMRQNRWRYRQCRLAFKARPQCVSVGVPDSRRDRYHKNLNQIRRDNSFCVSLSVTTIKKAIDGYPKGYPCAAHVVLCGANGRVLYETLVQHSNQKTILALGTKIHQLRYSHLKYARQIERVRKDVYKYLLAADVVIGHGIINHLNALNFTKEDIKRVSNKLRNINSYYSPIPGQSLTLPVIAYLVLDKIIDSSTYYPKVNAQISMILYVSERHKIEANKTIQNSVYGDIYQWPPHRKVSEAIKYNYEHNIAWPRELYHRAIALQGQRTILIENRVPVPEDLINFPYENNEVHEHDPKDDDFSEPNFQPDPSNQGGEELDETPSSEKKAGDSEKSIPIEWDDVIQEPSLKETSSLQYIQSKPKNKEIPYREPVIYDSDTSDTTCTQTPSRNSSPEPGYVVDPDSAERRKKELDELYKQKTDEIIVDKLKKAEVIPNPQDIEQIYEQYRLKEAKSVLKETRPDLYEGLTETQTEKVTSTVSDLEPEPMEECNSDDLSNPGLGPMISGQCVDKNSQTPEPIEEKEKETKDTEESSKETTEVAASETSEGILEELYVLFSEEPLNEFDENTVLAVDSELFAEFLGPEAGDLSCPEIAQPEQSPPLPSKDPE